MMKRVYICVLTATNRVKRRHIGCKAGYLKKEYDLKSLYRSIRIGTTICEPLVKRRATARRFLVRIEQMMAKVKIRVRHWDIYLNCRCDGHCSRRRQSAGSYL